jgi:hypothetical protein
MGVGLFVVKRMLADTFSKRFQLFLVSGTKLAHQQMYSHPHAPIKGQLSIQGL